MRPFRGSRSRPPMSAFRSTAVQAAARARLPEFDREAFRERLFRSLEEVAETIPGDKTRPAVLAALRVALEEGRAAVRERFEAGGSGTECVRGNCVMMDLLITALADFTVTHIYPTAGETTGEAFDIAAVGGYGRGELAPHSDLDLLFLLPYKRTARTEQVVEYMLYALWDLGLKVGHAVRNVTDCVRRARADQTIRTAVLETRHLWGGGELTVELRKRYDKEIVAVTAVEFVENKMRERDIRHRKMGDSRYLLEPNLKEGKGGLRDLQTLFWIAKYLYRVETVDEMVDKGVLTREEATRFIKARNFLWTARCHLHYLIGRPEDRMTFDTQAEIGARMGYTDHAGSAGVERFMKHYFLVAKDVGDLTRIFCAALEADAKRPPKFHFPRLAAFAKRRDVEGFALDGGRVGIADERRLRTEPVDMIRLFRVAQENGLDVHPSALRAITRALPALGTKTREDPEANRLFMEILTDRKDAEISLRRMNEAGVLARFIPDFGRVVAQMQYDMYHVYTVDEHTLFAIGILHAIENGESREALPLAADVMAKITSRRALYTAMLLHDVAKGRGGDHSALGAKVAEKLCPRLGLDAEETETVVWLVLHHLQMSEVALRRDLEDDKTTRDFVQLVQSLERLRLLLLLTTADIRAVGPDRWNAWKATLLRELHYRAEEALTGVVGGAGKNARVEEVMTALRPLLPDFDDAAFERYRSLGYPPYWLSFDVETLARHARLVREATERGRPLTVDARTDEARAVTEVTVLTADHHGLFSRISGALAAGGANIIDARIHTLADGLALDVFSVQDAAVGGPIEMKDKLERLSLMIARTLGGDLRPLRELTVKRPPQASRTRVFRVAPRVLIHNDVSAESTVVEVNGRDRPGLLYDLTRALYNLSVRIMSAKVSTYGEKAVDVFYVRDLFGMKITHEGKLAQLRETLLKALENPTEGK